MRISLSPTDRQMLGASLIVVLFIVSLILQLHKKRKDDESLKKFFLDNPDAALVIDVNFTVTAKNKSADAAGICIDNVITDDELKAAIKKALSSGDMQICSFKGRMYKVNCSRLSAKRRKKEQTVVFIKDISEEYAFCYVLPHEMRTPLAVIYGMAQNLKEGYASSDESKRIEYYDTILSESQRLSNLLNDVLRLMKLNNGLMKTETEPLDISYCLNTFAKNLEIMCERKGIRSSVRCVENTIAYFDYDLFIQLMTILADNAVKATNEGGVIEIGAASADIALGQPTDGNVFFTDDSIKLDDSRIFVYVRDDGKGISGDALPHIFDSLYSGDKTKKTGTGIGLALAKSVIHSIGETMIVKSTAGQGAIIGFTLKKADCAAEDENDM